MTNKEAQIIIGNIPIKPEVLDDCYDVTEYQAAKTKAIKALEQTRWIPCSERLPEENGQYLITVKYKPEADYENIYAEHGEWTDGQWDMFCFGHCGEVEDIIAWMPLPEPYKEDDEDDSN